MDSEEDRLMAMTIRDMVIDGMGDGSVRVNRLQQKGMESEKAHMTVAHGALLLGIVMLLECGVKDEERMQRCIDACVADARNLHAKANGKGVKYNRVVEGEVDLGSEEMNTAHRRMKEIVDRLFRQF